MTVYRERLWVAPWLFLGTGLIVPATILVFAPISLPVGIALALVLYAIIVAMLLSAAPTIEVTPDLLIAGRARIERSLLGEAVAFGREEAMLERGRHLDARAWLLIRGWVHPVVKVPVHDESDPTPYWLLSSRHPEALAHALNDTARSSLDH